LQKAKIFLDKIKPADTTDPEDSVGGTGADLFEWIWDSGSSMLIGTQVGDIVAGIGYSVSVTFLQDGASACPDNSTGFEVEIIPTPCMVNNIVKDDTESTFTCRQATLPVELASFTAELINEDVELLWSTETEENNERFEIQRSSDGISFETIDYVAGAGTTQVPISYAYHDYDVFDLGYRELYYRLKQVDYDGQFEYSNIEFINIDGTLGIEVIAVNFGDQYRLKETFGNGINQVDVFDMLGVRRSSRTYDNYDVVDVNTEGLQAGTYYIIINEQHRKKITIVR